MGFECYTRASNDDANDARERQTSRLASRCVHDHRAHKRFSFVVIFLQRLAVTYVIITYYYELYTYFIRGTILVHMQYLYDRLVLSSLEKETSPTSRASF